MENDIRDIFNRITERFDVPVRIGSRCETNTYYRIEDLSSKDIELCAEFLAERIENVCSPNLPEILITLPGSYTGLTEELAKRLSVESSPLPMIDLEDVHLENGNAGIVKNKRIMLINDVITTARSCLEAHTKVTIAHASVLCWVALVDRTFGPGPVPVISAFTGDPVLLLEELP